MISLWRSSPWPWYVSGPLICWFVPLLLLLGTKRLGLTGSMRAMGAAIAPARVTTVPLAMGKPLPKAGVFAHRQAEVGAANIAARWTASGMRRTFDGHGECFVETGDGRAGFGSGDFYAEPVPQIILKAPNRMGHWGKVRFEWRWLRQWFRAADCADDPRLTRSSQIRAAASSRESPACVDRARCTSPAGSGRIPIDRWEAIRRDDRPRTAPRRFRL